MIPSSRAFRVTVAFGVVVAGAGMLAFARVLYTLLLQAHPQFETLWWVGYPTALALTAVLILLGQRRVGLGSYILAVATVWLSYILLWSMQFISARLSYLTYVLFARVSHGMNLRLEFVFVAPAALCSLIVVWLAMRARTHAKELTD